jgi:hypothetical protein
VRHSRTKVRHIPIDGVENKHPARDESTFKLIDEQIIPRGGVPPSKFLLVRRFRSIHTPMPDHDSNGFKCIRDNRPLRRPHDVELPSQYQNHEPNKEHAQAHQERGPESNVALYIRRGEEGEGSDIDTDVEDHIDALDGNSRVDDDALSRFQRLDRHPFPGILIRDQGRDIRFDAAGSDSNREDCRDEAP